MLSWLTEILGADDWDVADAGWVAGDNNFVVVGEGSMDGHFDFGFAGNIVAAAEVGESIDCDGYYFCHTHCSPSV